MRLSGRPMTVLSPTRQQLPNNAAYHNNISVHHIYAHVYAYMYVHHVYLNADILDELLEATVATDHEEVMNSVEDDLDELKSLQTKLHRLVTINLH